MKITTAFRMITACAFACLNGATFAKNLSIDVAAATAAEGQRNRAAAQVYFAPIHSEQELHSYLAGNKSTPLDALDPKSEGRFLASLTFNAKGITGFSYEDLRSLSPSEAYSILALFGAQEAIIGIPFDSASTADEANVGLLSPIVIQDYPDARCQPPATCLSSHQQICLSTCQNP